MIRAERKTKALSGVAEESTQRTNPFAETTRMQRFLLWLVSLMTALICFTPQAQAQTAADYTQGVAVNGNVATVWFKPTGSTTSWVDVHYRLNGGAQQNLRMGFNGSTARYEQAVSPVATGNTLSYNFTYNKGTPAYDSAVFNFTVGSGGGTVATPTFSPAPGSYSTAQTVSIATATSGATIRYTTDGSAPSASSPAYTGPISVAASQTVKAIATKAGMTTSAVATGAYTIGGGAVWNGNTTFQIANATGGRWRDDQVYWAIIGRDWATGQFVHVDNNGALVPMKMSDNGALVKNGVAYSNYFFSLAQKRSVTIPPIDSARLLMSVGSPMYIQINTDINGNVGYAGANIENASDPNNDVVFDFGEFAILPKGRNGQGIYINTTRVDQFGFPLKLRLQGLNGYDRSVGEPLTETRDQLFDRYVSEVPAEFKGLAQPNFSTVPARTRIIAPAHFTFQEGGANAHYLDDYINAMWAKFSTQNLVFTLDTLGTFTGRVVGEQFRFTGGKLNGTYYIHRRPSTSETLLGRGVLDDATGQSDGEAIKIQKQIQAQVCAALNRHVLDNPANWYNPAAFYPAGQKANWFAKFWHDHSLDRLAYGFAYDDVGGFSPSLHSDAPTTVTYTIGW
jgi:hypothetical protein